MYAMGGHSKRTYACNEGGGVKFLPFWCVFTKSVPSKLAECRHGYIDDRVMNSYQNCGVY